MTLKFPQNLSSKSHLFMCLIAQGKLNKPNLNSEGMQMKHTRKYKKRTTKRNTSLEEEGLEWSIYQRDEKRQRDENRQKEGEVGILMSSCESGPGWPTVRDLSGERLRGHY